MKLATLRNGRPDGQLVVVSADLGRCVSAGRIAPNLQAALDNWETARPALEDLSGALESGGIAAQPFEAASAMAPLPRAYQRLVGAAYPTHAARLLAASGDRPPEPLQRPFLTQAASDRLLGPGDALALAEVEASLDFSAEIAAITGPVPQQPTRAEAAAAIRLVTIASELTLRRRIAEDLRFGYGYLNSKPAVCLAPVAVTPLGLGRMWGAEKFTGTVRVLLNNMMFGQPDAGRDMQFDFAELIMAAARTRPLATGTIVCSGPVSARHEETPPMRRDGIGFTSIAEARASEKQKYGRARTPYLKPGDRIRIVAVDAGDRPLFGSIDHTVPVPAPTHV